MREIDHREASDEALVEAAKDGQVRAFDVLLDRHQARVLRVLRLLGVPTQDREDVAQDVFIRVFRHLAGFRRGRPFGAWLYRVTVNAAHDYRGRRGRLARGESPWSEDLDQEPDRGSGPADRVHQAELRRTLEAALEALTERERAVFVLRELEGLESAEVARALGISQITVRRHLGRARKHLQQALEGQASRETPEIDELALDPGRRG